MKELTFTMLGNANCGKSTLTGVLSNPLLLRCLELSDEILTLRTDLIPPDLLDDGDGKARQSVLQFKHEQDTGRTSSITYNYIRLFGKYLINIIDLAGHEHYLKTTLTGITSSYPDLAFVCVEKSITKITKEHLSVVVSLNIPFIILMTKVDIMPLDKLKKNIKRIKQLLSTVGKKTLLVKSPNDLQTTDCLKWIPVIPLSAKTGLGLDHLLYSFNTIQPQPKAIPPIFIVQNIFNVKGYGLVVSGITGVELSKQQEVYVGPFANEGFVKTRIKTLHNDYREFVETLPPNTKGCLCFRLEPKFRRLLRPGILVSPSVESVQEYLVRSFTAKVSIFGTHSTLIKAGYVTYIHSGIIRGPIRFREVEYEERRQTLTATIEFVKHPYYVTKGETFLFREGQIKGVGIIT